MSDTRVGRPLVVNLAPTGMAAERWHMEDSAVHQVFIPGLFNHSSVAGRLKVCLPNFHTRPPEDFNK